MVILFNIIFLLTLFHITKDHDQKLTSHLPESAMNAQSGATMVNISNMFSLSQYRNIVYT